MLLKCRKMILDDYPNHKISRIRDQKKRFEIFPIVERLVA